jgi:hypothetical protein
MTATPEQIAYQNAKMDEISVALQSLAMSYDSKILAAVTLTFSARLLRALYSAKLLSEDEVVAMIAAGIENVTTPLAETPRVATIGTPPGKAS